MRLIAATDSVGRTVRRQISRTELVALSGPQLAALLFPAPTSVDIEEINEFLDHYRETES